MARPNPLATVFAACIFGAAIGHAAAAAPPLSDTMSPQAHAMMERLFGRQNAALQPPAGPRDWDAANRAAGAFMAKLTAPTLQHLSPTVTTVSLGGVQVLKVVPHNFTGATPILIYLHGGAYTLFSARDTLAGAAEMADAAALAVYSVDYTLAPHGNWRTVSDQVIAVYGALLKQGHSPDSIGIFGDSAGGGLTAGAVLKLRDAGIKMPGALVLLSPWSDITAAGDTQTTLAAADPMLREADLRPSADAYADPRNQKNPTVSPVYGNYAPGFPPTLIQGGTREILLSGFVRQYRAIVDAGGTAQLDLYEGMPHVFQDVLYGTPEATTAYRMAARFWHDHLAPAR